MQIGLNIGEIVDHLQGTTTLDRSIRLENFTSLKNAQPTDLVIVLDKQEGSVFDDIPPEAIAQTNAGAIIAREALIPGKPYILVDDPLSAFNLLITKIKPALSIPCDEYRVHSSAIIGENVSCGEKTIVDPHAVIETKTTIGKQCHIGAGVFIGSQCTIGNNVIIHPNVTILERTSIGDNTIIHSGAVIGSDGFGYHVTQKGLRKIPHIGTVRIGNNVEIGANTCIDRAAFDETIIGDNVKLDNQIHIAHNVSIGAHTAIIAQSGVAGSARIGMGCQIGGQVGIKNHVIIGDGAKIVSQSGVMRNVNTGEIVAGAPAMPFMQWKRLTIALTKLPALLSDLKKYEQKSSSFFKRWLHYLFGS